MRIHFKGISKKQTEAIEEIKGLLGIELDTKGILVTVLRGNEDIRIKEEPSGFILEYGREHQFIIWLLHQYLVIYSFWELMSYEKE